MIKIIEGLIKGVISLGLSEYQKHKVKEKATSDGTIIDTFNASYKKQGAYSYTVCYVVVTKKEVLIKPVGSITTTQLSIPALSKNFISGNRKILFGLVSQDSFDFTYNNTSYLLVFSGGTGEKFIKTLGHS